ncbi:MAG: hypothetical protein GAKPKEKM_01249 [Rhodocyclaceae bacterium]|nr:hypothetical protein [Rhodocyclaceae bacterium]
MAEYATVTIVGTERVRYRQTRRACTEETTTAPESQSPRDGGSSRRSSTARISASSKGLHR